MNQYKSSEKNLISQLKQQSPAKQYTRLMNNYEQCRQMHNSLELKKAAPEQPKEQKLLKVKTVRSIALIPVAPKVPAPLPERQQKYLGLIIEKDEEQLIEVRTDSEFETEEFVMRAPVDPIHRVYKPIREKYITIVKNSRKMFLSAHEKRGRRDLMKTQRILRKIGRQYAFINQQNEAI
jgi:hypothetical protein